MRSIPTLEEDLIQQLFRMARAGISGTFVSVLLVTWIFVGEIQENGLLVWCGAHIIIQAYRNLITRQYKIGRKSGLSETGSIDFANRYTLGAAATGFAWGALPFLGLDTTTASLTPIVLIVQLGVVAPGAVTMGAILPLFNTLMSINGHRLFQSP